jgi:hypothetical protein
MGAFVSKWDSWGKKSSNEVGGVTAKTDTSTPLVAGKSSNEVGGVTATTDTTAPPADAVACAVSPRTHRRETAIRPHLRYLFTYKAVTKEAYPAVVS